MKKTGTLLAVVALSLALTTLGTSQSFLEDREQSGDNTFSVGTWVSVSSGDVVINEVYYDVAPDKGDEGDRPNPNEWVELYNNTDAPIDLKDWTLNDNSQTRTISHRTVYIPARGFAVLAKAANTWTYWVIPDSAQKIELGQKIGDGLDDDGDRLILKDNLGNTIDAISWGSDETQLSPAIGDVAEGHSIARNPAGFDSDQASDFVDLPLPNPGTNPHPVLVTNLDLYLREDQRAAGFSLTGIAPFSTIVYDLAYSHASEEENIEEHVTGTLDNGTGQESLKKEWLELGTCSDLGETCVYHEGVTQVSLAVVLSGEGIPDRNLEAMVTPE